MLIKAWKEKKMLQFEKLLQKEKNAKAKANLMETHKNEADGYAWHNLQAGRITRQEYEKQVYDDTTYYQVEALRIEAQYIHDVARYEFINYALNEWKKAAAKYDGKPLGEKTKNKINEELREKNIYFYFDGTTSLNFGYLRYDEKDQRKYNSYDFSYYDDLKVYSKYNEPFFLDNENKININGSYHEPKKRELKGSYHAQAVRLIKQKEKLNKLMNDYNNAVELFNAIAPRDYKRVEKAR